MDLDLRDLHSLIAEGVEHALTLWPEWIFGFTDLDKRVENRDWPPPRTMVGRRIALHSGKHIGGRPGKVAKQDGMESFVGTAEVAGWTAGRHGPGWLELSKDGRLVHLDIDKIVTSAIGCTAVLDRLIPPQEAGETPWYNGGWGWVFRDVVKLPNPIACKGAQGIWAIRGLL